MYGVKVEKFSQPAPFLTGLKRLRQGGLTPRGFLFLALDPSGSIHVGVPEDPEQITRIKVGEKLALVWPLEGRYFHFDSIHRLPADFVLWNGDRRLKDPGDAADVAAVVAAFLKGGSAKNVLFGCTPHQPGAWITIGDPNNVIALHEHGFSDVVPVPQGLLARRAMDHRLFFLPFAALLEKRMEQFAPIFESPLGNLLLLERRVMQERLVLSCEQGLIEVNVAALPRVVECSRATSNGSIAVVGRIDGGAFAVTSGSVQPWGLDQLRPALLLGGAGTTLVDLGHALQARPSE